MDTNPKDIVFFLPENRFNTHSGSGSLQDFVVVLRSDEYQPELLAQLEAILKAIQVDLNERVTIIEIVDNPDCRIKEICPVSDYVFIFGIDPVKTGFPAHITKYNFLFSGETLYLFADALTTLKSNVETKKQLWNCLKSHFIDQKN